MKTIYKTTAGQFDIFQEWKECNLENLSQSGIFKNILCIDNSARDFGNIFEDTIDKSEGKTINGILVYIDANGDFEYDDYTQETDNRTEKIEQWIGEHTLEIEARGYSQGDYESYNIIVNDKRKIKAVEKELEWIKEIFTIIETRVELQSRNIIERGDEEFKTEWEFIDAVSSQKEFADLEELTNELLKQTGIKREQLASEADEAPFVG